jgi:flagellar assembly protein FliH
MEEAAAEQGRRAGFERGLFEGRAYGETEARAAADRRLAELIATTEAAVATLAQQIEAGRAELSGEVVDLALRIAEAVVGSAVEVGQFGGREALERALASAPERGAATARFHPDDAAELEDAAAMSVGRELAIVADPTLRRGDCVLDVGSTRIDATITGAFGRVRDVLLPAMDVDAAFEQVMRS